jgi:chloramphenicol 3-O phosphotransferase
MATEQTPPGTVILLNGTASAGKTSIARALQALAPVPYLLIGADMLGDMCPPERPGGVQAAERVTWVVHSTSKPWLTELRVGPWSHRLVSAHHRSIAAYARLGFNVVVDHILQEPRWLAECAALWRDLPVLFVGVRCPLAVAEAREKARGDRRRGVARWQFERVHALARYDLEVDTAALSAEECAAAILCRLDEGPPPDALRRAGDGVLAGASAKAEERRDDHGQ